MICLAEGLLQKVSSREYHEESCSQKVENSLVEKVTERVPLDGISVTLCVVESQEDRVLTVKDVE